MDDAVLVDDRVAIRRKRPAQRQIRIQLPKLVEVDHPQSLGCLDPAAEGNDLAAQQTQQGSLSAAVRADESYSHSRRDRKIEAVEQHPAVEAVRDTVQVDQPFGFSIGGHEIDAGGIGAAPGFEVRQLADHLPGLVDARLGLGRARLRAAAQPLHLRPDPILKRLLPLGLGDRKSTRLNSSHEWISYAVFCLKKKKMEEKNNLSKKNESQ